MLPTLLELAETITGTPTEYAPKHMNFREDYNGQHISIHRRENQNGTTYTSSTTTPGGTVHLTRFETAVDALSAARHLIDGNLDLIPWTAMKRAGLLSPRD